MPERQERDDTEPEGRAAAKERELRLALVCYGGVSLAVYMHGISREILALVRASRAYHSVAEGARATATFEVAGDDCARFEIDTETTYFELLRDIGKTLDLRVVVDVIAGASAGGINGIMLARALAFDLTLEKHREFWLDLADVTELLDPSARARLWSKPFMRPFLWAISQWYRRRARLLGAEGEDPEVIKKLSLFMRSRWFQPPFSGRRMGEMMLDAVEAIGDGDISGRSLLPLGVPLDLFVTTTDFWGHSETIRIHDPPVIEEREHRHTFRFQHIRLADDTHFSQFRPEDLPSLAFAARATSSYPGAFPPARLEEMDAILADRGQAWPGRARFLENQFGPLSEAGEDPDAAAFIDGSVLMNKPISLALQAVQSHPAHREVDRRLVYIEPNPEIRRLHEREVPGFFKTIKGAMSDIPRNQPIRDDLEWLAEFNEHVRLQRQVVEAVKPDVMQMIEEVLGRKLRRPPDVRKLAKLRVAANERSARDAAYSYSGYARLKVVSVLLELVPLLRARAGIKTRAEAAALIENWARERDIRPLGAPAKEAQHGDDAPWVGFLRRFDVRYRVRRLRFLIRRLNELYSGVEIACTSEDRAWLDGIKATLYMEMEDLRRDVDRQSARTESPAGETPELEAIDALLGGVADALALTEHDDRLDVTLARCARACPDESICREVIIAYLGFPYYDVLTFPMARSRSLDELEEIKVDRISVNDANTLRKGSARQILKGVELGNFGAFFSRKFRENDYLWGRLTGAERLVDIVVSAVPEALADGTLDPVAIKKRLFLAILAAEKENLSECEAMIAALEADAEKLE